MTQQTAIMEFDNEISRLDRQLDRAIEMALDAPTDKLKAKTVELETRIKQLQRERDRQADGQVSDVRVSDYIARVGSIDDMPRKEKQIFVGKMIKKITAFSDGYCDVSTAISEAVDKIGGATQI